MWTVVYMTKKENDIDIVLNKLSIKGIISRKRKNNDFIEILVPDAELNLAHGIIIDLEIWLSERDY